MKRCLKKSNGKLKVNCEEFETLLVKIQGILNSRTLTYVSEEFVQLLTPSSLCVGHRLLDKLAEAKYQDESNSAKGLSKRQKHLNLVINHFWKRWHREYLTKRIVMLRWSLNASLREHHHGKESEQQRVKHGDVCVHQDLKPHQHWKVGVVQKLISGRDGRVRAAFVRLVSGGKCVELHRPVERLHLIEVPKDNQEGEPYIKFVSDKEVKIGLICKYFSKLFRAVKLFRTVYIRDLFNIFD